MRQTLRVYWDRTKKARKIEALKKEIEALEKREDVEFIRVNCGSMSNRARLPVAIGRGLINGEARAVLSYDGKERTAIKAGPRYYMRVKG